jgi:hypothetical protein
MIVYFTVAFIVFCLSARWYYTLLGWDTHRDEGASFFYGLLTGLFWPIALLVALLGGLIYGFIFLLFRGLR